jgi:hypothetical protein
MHNFLWTARPYKAKLPIYSTVWTGAVVELASMEPGSSCSQEAAAAPYYTVFIMLWNMHWERAPSKQYKYHRKKCY